MRSSKAALLAGSSARMRSTTWAGRRERRRFMQRSMIFMCALCSGDPSGMRSSAMGDAFASSLLLTTRQGRQRAFRQRSWRCRWLGQLRPDCRTSFAGAAVDVRGGPGCAGSAAGIMAGEGLSPVRQGPDATGADGFAAFIAIHDAGAVAAMRAGAARPVEFAGVVRLLCRLAAREAAIGFAFGGARFVTKQPGDLEPVRRA